jgi:hypothetical protein
MGTALLRRHKSYIEASEVPQVAAEQEETQREANEVDQDVSEQSAQE